MRITRVSDAVHLATGTDVNWALITDGDAVTLVDAGYPTPRRSSHPSTADASGRRALGRHVFP